MKHHPTNRQLRCSGLQTGVAANLPSYLSKVCLIGLIACSQWLWAQTTSFSEVRDFTQVREKELEKIAAGESTQRAVDALDDERMDLLQQYRATVKQHRDLRKYNDQLRNIIESQQQEQQSLSQQIDRIGTLEQDIVPLMSDMLDALEHFIKLDTPFFLEERRARVNKLRELMNRANVANSEKYRRVLEAYQIENDYGRTLEAKQLKLYTTVEQEDADEIINPTVNFLKVGRLGYYYQTLDGKDSFFWSMANNDWVPLDSSYNQPIRTGIQMANEQAAPDLLLLPVELPLNF